MIGERKGEFDGMLEFRKFNVIFVSKNNPVGFKPDMAEGILVEYDGTRIEVPANFGMFICLKIRRLKIYIV